MLPALASSIGRLKIENTIDRLVRCLFNQIAFSYSEKSLQIVVLKQHAHMYFCLVRSMHDLGLKSETRNLDYSEISILKSALVKTSLTIDSASVASTSQPESMSSHPC